MQRTLTKPQLGIPLLLVASGCNDSGETKNVATNAERSAIDEYKAMIEADEARMNAGAKEEKITPSATTPAAKTSEGKAPEAKAPAAKASGRGTRSQGRVTRRRGV